MKLIKKVIMFILALSVAVLASPIVLIGSIAALVYFKKNNAPKEKKTLAAIACGISAIGTMIFAYSMLTDNEPKTSKIPEPPKVAQVEKLKKEDKDEKEAKEKPDHTAKKEGNKKAPKKKKAKKEKPKKKKEHKEEKFKNDLGLTKDNIDSVNDYLAHSLQEGKDFALGKLDPNGNPTENGTPDPRYNYSLLASSVKFEKDGILVIQVEDQFLELNEEDRQTVGNSFQGMGKAALLMKGIEGVEDKHIFASFRQGIIRIGHSKMTNTSEFKWKK